MAAPAHMPGEDVWQLFDLGAGLSPADLSSHLSKVTQLCKNWFSADGVSLFVRLEDTDAFILAAQSGADRELPGATSFRLGEGIAGNVARSGKPLILNGPVDHPRSGQKTGPPIGSSIVAPLTATDGETVGVLNMTRNLGTPRFQEEDARTATALSRHLGFALANARLVARLHASAERERAMAAQTNLILNSLHVGVLVVDAVGRIEQANGEASRFLRQTDSDILGQPWQRVVGRLPRNLGRALKLAHDSALRGITQRHDLPKVGGRYLTAYTAPVPRGGVLLVIEDHTEQLETERELQRSRRMAEIGQMTAALAHEIRNPLTSIRGAAQMIASDNSLEGAKKWATVVEEEALALNSLCDQFLEIARPLSLHTEDVDLNTLLETLAARTRLEAPENVSIEFRALVGRPIINADGPKLVQALRNLIRNAIEAMPDGGELSLGLRRSKGFIRIFVKDTGIGMTDEQVAKLFTAFFTTKPKGTGLGLCNARRVVEAHGGAIHVRSRVGKGTTFEILMPLEASA